MRVLYLIVARGGSRSILKKNLQRIGDLSLVGYKARSAQQAESCARLIISTDDEEIQAEARALGVEVPFTRPAHLATATATSEDVVTHAMEWADQQGQSYDAIMLLEPSSPFGLGEDYDAAVAMMAAKDANVVVGMREVEVASIFVGRLDAEGRISQIVDQMRSATGLRRQDQAPECTMNGAFYLMRWDYFKRTRSRYIDRDNTYGYMMDRFRSIEVDEPVDLAWAQFLVANGYVDATRWAS